MTPLPKEHRLAIEQFLLNTTVPVLYDGADAADQIGTGTLFELDGRLFFITAGHVLDDIELERLALPSNPISSDLQTLGRFRSYRPDEEHIDLAVLELLEEENVQELRKGWSALTLANVAHPAPHNTYIICGYPSSIVRRRGERLSGTLISVYTELQPSLPANALKPVDPDLDLFFYYDLEATDIWGKPIATPNLRGTSGSSIWQYTEPPEGALWSPHRTLSIVGIQASARHGEYARAKSWSYILAALRKIDPDLVATAAG